MTCRRHTYNKKIVYGNCITIGGKYLEQLNYKCWKCDQLKRLTKAEKKKLENDQTT